MKKLFTIFLLFIISTQCLPIKELGKRLYDSSYIDEDVNCDGVEKKEGKDSIKEFYFANTSLQINIKNAGLRFIRISTMLIDGPIPDVTTPPPNA